MDLDSVAAHARAIGFTGQFHIAVPQDKAEPIYIRVPLSKSFTECPQDRFNRYFEAAMAALAKHANCDVLELYFEWMRQRGRRAA